MFLKEIWILGIGKKNSALKRRINIPKHIYITPPIYIFFSVPNLQHLHAKIPNPKFMVRITQSSENTVDITGKFMDVHLKSTFQKCYILNTLHFTIIGLASYAIYINCCVHVLTEQITRW